VLLRPGVTGVGRGRAGEGSRSRGVPEADGGSDVRAGRARDRDGPRERAGAPRSRDAADVQSERDRAVHLAGLAGVGRGAVDRCVGCRVRRLARGRGGGHAQDPRRAPRCRIDRGSRRCRWWLKTSRFRSSGARSLAAGCRSPCEGGCSRSGGVLSMRCRSVRTRSRLSGGQRIGHLLRWRAGLFTALYIAICEALRASGLLPLHAAVAVPPAGSVDWQPPAVPPAADEGGAMPPPAIAFLGGRGAGKSTTLVHLVRAGWTPVAEDVCWVDPEAFVVYGWDRGVRLRRPAIEAFFPDLGSAPLVPEPDGKFLLGYEHLLCCGAGRGGRGEGH